MLPQSAPGKPFSHRSGFRNADLFVKWDDAIALIYCGADVTEMEVRYGDNALMIAAKLGKVRLVEALLEFLDVNSTNNVGVSALHNAAYSGRKDVVERFNCAETSNRWSAQVWP